MGIIIIKSCLNFLTRVRGVVGKGQPVELISKFNISHLSVNLPCRQWSSGRSLKAVHSFHPRVPWELHRSSKMLIENCTASDRDLLIDIHRIELYRSARNSTPPDLDQWIPSIPKAKQSSWWNVPRLLVGRHATFDRGCSGHANACKSSLEVGIQYSVVS